MMRGRDWRRWQNDRKLSKTLRYIRQRYLYEWLNVNLIPSRFKSWTYQRKISISETETIAITNREELEKYQHLRARAMRDTPKTCNCSGCRNRRHSNFSKKWDRITHQEQKSFFRKSFFKNLKFNQE